MKHPFQNEVCLESDVWHIEFFFFLVKQLTSVDVPEPIGADQVPYPEIHKKQYYLSSKAVFTLVNIWGACISDTASTASKATTIERIAS